MNGRDGERGWGILIWVKGDCFWVEGWGWLCGWENVLGGKVDVVVVECVEVGGEVSWVKVN